MKLFTVPSALPKVMPLLLLCLTLPLLALPFLTRAAQAQMRLSPERLIQTWGVEWTRTDFTKYSIDLNEIVSGGPPKDGIPPIDRPAFVSPEEAAKWLTPEEPVIVYGHGGETKAYPLQILIWHEIVNDSVGGRPVVVTFCPLCNSALVFDRKVEGRVLDFGTTGKLRMSDLVMWDRQTESWWQQLTGQGIVGRYTGVTLKFLTASLVSFSTFQENFPKGLVLSRETGIFRDYGRNPYIGYDRAGNRPFLMRGPIDRRLPPMERVIAVEFGGKAKAYPFRHLRKAKVVNDSLGSEQFVILFREGTRSALDGALIGESRDVGTGAVYSSIVDGRQLRFLLQDGKFVDRETGSQWNLLGRAVEGTLRGKQLRPLVHAQHFAFAWLAFRPQSTVWSPE